MTLCVQSKWDEVQDVFGAGRIIIFSNSLGRVDGRDQAAVHAASRGLHAEVLLHGEQKPLGGRDLSRHINGRWPLSSGAMIGDRVCCCWLLLLLFHIDFTIGSFSLILCSAT